MDSATSFLFGESVDSMSTPLALPYNVRSPTAHSSSKDVSFSSAFKLALEGYSFRLAIGKMWPLWEMTGDKNQDKVKVLHEFVDPIVERGLSKKKTIEAAERKCEGDDAEESTTLLDHLVSVTDGAFKLASSAPQSEIPTAQNAQTKPSFETSF